MTLIIWATRVASVMILRAPLYRAAGAAYGLDGRRYDGGQRPCAQEDGYADDDEVEVLFGVGKLVLAAAREDEAESGPDQEEHRDRHADGQHDVEQGLDELAEVPVAKRVLEDIGAGTALRRGGIVGGRL